MYLIFDTETTGLPKNYKAPISDTDNWPRCIQIAWQLHDEMGNMVEHKDYLISPDGFSIPYQSEKIHGISTDLALEQGVPLQQVLEEFKEILSRSKFVVGQNVVFDVNVMGCEFYRLGVDSLLTELPVLDTCTEVTATMCQIPGGRGGKFKLPTLTELHQHLFGKAFGEAHNATADVEATTRCFLELIRIKNFTIDELQNEDNYLKTFIEANPSPFENVGLNHLNLKAASDEIRKRKAAEEGTAEFVDVEANLELLKEVPFSHLHNHSQFSILQSTIQINGLIQRAVEQGSPCVALTDLSNMMAVYHFVEAVIKHNKGVKGKVSSLEDEWQNAAEEEKVELEVTIEKEKGKHIKPVVGCDIYVCTDRNNKKIKDNGYLVPLLAKNRAGYHNLAKLASAAFVEGFYYVPRIDKGILKDHAGDIICLTGGLGAEIPGKILNEGIEKAEEAFVWYHELFGDDFYVELIRHGLEENELVNKTLLGFAKKYGVKYIASNDTYYLDQEEAEAHDILLCIKEGEKQTTPIGRGRGFRYGFPNQEFYFKTPEQMKELFKDLPDAIINTNEICDKIEIYGLARDVLLPAYDIPEEFQDERDKDDDKLKIGENNLLRHLTYVGAEKRYGEIEDHVRERLDFELSIIQKTGYPGYFLIVQDFCEAARQMGVSVGPGRGSAAGSAVAYCIGITNVDPVKYDLLFERFLNPDRVSMPDIDIDFDDEGRGRVIQYVIDKYGENQVAQIITYGTMAAKSSIKDSARALDLPLSEAERMAKLVPDMKLKKMFKMSDDDLAAKLSPEQIEMADALKEIYEQDDETGHVLRTAHTLEGSVRNTGIHACGVIITPDDIRKYVPVALSKDSTADKKKYCTQYDNSVAEEAGLLKMDFLGLKTLTLIKDTLRIVKERHNVDIDIEEISLEDTTTYELFQRGETVGVFQYESAGMQKYLKELKPSVFADLIAMNALYRPGPLEYIPSFIRRKHGEEEIVYDIEASSEYLAETYGITVYQEQVMLLSQSLAGFTKGEADTLRKAMGKKKLDLLAKLKPKFLDQGEANGHNRDRLGKMWTDWEAFASYAFNKSHSTCYAWVAYQTAYLKAHYPAEYMAAVLSNNMNDIKQVTFFMEECQRMGLEVLGPDVNESFYKFSVNKKGAVRFGMGGAKGIGEGAVNAIVEERKENGDYTSFFDFCRRVSLKECNKRVFESLANGGGFDRFTEVHRAQYFNRVSERDLSLIELGIKFGHSFQESKNSSQVSMFGGEGAAEELPEPVIPKCEEWDTMTKLNKEKEVVGVYISGHPLDDFKVEMKYLCNNDLSVFEKLHEMVGQELLMAGIVSGVEHRKSKKEVPFGMFNLEDYGAQNRLFAFGKTYEEVKAWLMDGEFVFVRGSVQERTWGGQTDFSFNIKKMIPLREAMDKFAHKLTIKVKMEDLNSEAVGVIADAFLDFPGDKTVLFEVEDEQQAQTVKLTSPKRQIEFSGEFFTALEQVPELVYEFE